jgi:hypothetical protein
MRCAILPKQLTEGKIYSLLSTGFVMRHSAKQHKHSQSVVDSLVRKDERLLPISLLEGPTHDEFMLALNLRHEWRGFSFGNFWFGYYFAVSQSSPQVEERWAV